jgi:hypothetical protein
MSNLTDTAHQWAERGAYLFAGVAVVSLQQAAFVLTIVATTLSIILAAIKLHDRLRYGRNPKGD